MPFSRRELLRSLCRTAAVFSFDQLISALPLGVAFVNVAREAGLHLKTTFGGERKNKYLLETTGCGAAFFDYDDDGWLDIFLVNGTRFDAKYAKGAEPTNRLYKNNRDGTFTDVTAAARLIRTGWGQGVCVGDYDNDGHDDLFVTYWGDCALYHNNGDGTFTDVAVKAGVTTRTTTGLKRWNTGGAFVDYDRDGHLDLFVANYIDFDPKTAPLPQSRPCLYNPDGKPQAGMGVSAVDYNCDGYLDLVKTNFAGDTSSLYKNMGNMVFEDQTFQAGLGKNTRFLGWGVGFVDFDNDGWSDIFV